MSVHVYGDNAMKKTAVYKWVTRFYEGRDSVTDEESSGRPATRRTEYNITKVRRLTVKSIAEQGKIDRETAWKILSEDLDIWVYAKWSLRSSPKSTVCEGIFG
jgi:hypothetical protein